MPLEMLVLFLFICNEDKEKGVISVHLMIKIFMFSYRIFIFLFWHVSEDREPLVGISYYFHTPPVEQIT